MLIKATLSFFSFIKISNKIQITSCPSDKLLEKMALEGDVRGVSLQFPGSLAVGLGKVNNTVEGCVGQSCLRFGGPEAESVGKSWMGTGWSQTQAL